MSEARKAMIEIMDVNNNTERKEPTADDIILINEEIERRRKEYIVKYAPPSGHVPHDVFLMIQKQAYKSMGFDPPKTRNIEGYDHKDDVIIGVECDLPFGMIGDRFIFMSRQKASGLVLGVYAYMTRNCSTSSGLTKYISLNDIAEFFSVHKVSAKKAVSELAKFEAAIPQKKTSSYNKGIQYYLPEIKQLSELTESKLGEPNDN